MGIYKLFKNIMGKDSVEIKVEIEVLVEFEDTFELKDKNKKVDIREMEYQLQRTQVDLARAELQLTMSQIEKRNDKRLIRELKEENKELLKAINEEIEQHRLLYTMVNVCRIKKQHEKEKAEINKDNAIDKVAKMTPEEINKNWDELKKAIEEE